jgi:hypothetical protein
MAIIMCIWLVIVLFILFDLGVFTKSKFVAFGPRDDLTFMHVPIDTYYKYYLLLSMIIFHTFITDLIADSLVPHVLNVVQDTKNKYIPHRTRTYLLITSAWSIYCSVSQLFVIFIAFGQLDLLLVRLASDLFANFFTLNMYLDSKIYDPELHAKSVSSKVKNNTEIFVIEEDDENEIVYARTSAMKNASNETELLQPDHNSDSKNSITIDRVHRDDDEKASLLLPITKLK